METKKIILLPSYTLIRSSRKTLSLELWNWGELTVRAPRLFPLFLIERWVRSKHLWIEKHQKRLSKKPKTWKEHIYSASEIRSRKDTLKSYIEKRVHDLSLGKNLPKIEGIKVTQSEYRWGSCSARNRLCFSYRLFEYMSSDSYLDFIDAVIIHELAHLREKNHQKPFWDLVYTWMPNYRTIIRKWRSQWGQSLE